MPHHYNPVNLVPKTTMNALIVPSDAIFFYKMNHKKENNFILGNGCLLQDFFSHAQFHSSARLKALDIHRFNNMYA